MRHREIPAGHIHVPYNRTFANAAARLAYTPVADDDGKFALQLDNRTIWLMTTAAGVTNPVALPTPAEIGAEPSGTASSTMAAHVAAPDPHTQYATSAEAQLTAQAEVGVHEGAVDPHPQYQTSAEVTSSISGAVSVHEGASDPHPQYQTATEVATAISGHSALPNPHGTTASDVGAIPASEKGAANGVATLDGSGKIPSTQIPASAISDTYVVNSQASMLALVAQVGDVAVRTDLSKSFILVTEPASVLGNWQELLAPSAAVQSVNGQVGVVILGYADVGAAPTTHAHAQGDITGLAASLAGKSDTSHNHDATYSQLGHTHTPAQVGAEPVGTVAAHVAASDPHPQYLTDQEGDARYQTITKTTMAGQFATTANTPQATALAVPVQANKTYRIKATLLARSVSTGVGVGVGLNGPAFVSFAYSAKIPISGTNCTFLNANVYNSSGTATSSPVANQNFYIELEGLIEVGASSGSLEVMLRSEINGQQVSIEAGSTISVEEVGVAF